MGRSAGRAREVDLRRSSKNNNMKSRSKLKMPCSPCTVEANIPILAALVSYYIRASIDGNLCKIAFYINIYKIAP